MNMLKQYTLSKLNLSKQIAELNKISTKLSIISEFSKCVNIIDKIDPTIAHAAYTFGIVKDIPPIDLTGYNAIVLVGIEEVISSISQAILKLIGNITEGFSNTAESFSTYQKTLMNTTNQSFNRLKELYSSTTDNKDKIVRVDIPEFYSLVEQSKIMLMFIKNVFQDRIQCVTSQETLFGLSNNTKKLDSYDTIFPPEFTSHMQTKIGINFDAPIKNENDATEGNVSAQAIKFNPPFTIPFKANNVDRKTIDQLGYGNIEEIGKFIKIVENSIFKIIEELPELINRCKDAKTSADKILSDQEKELSNEEAKDVVNTVMIWGSSTDTCLRCISFYMRVYQEILNTLYESVKGD